MPGDPFKPAQAGQPLDIPAAAYNEFIKTAQLVRRMQRQGGAASVPYLPPGQCYVENASGGDLDRFAVLGIGNPLVDPADSPDAFAERAGLSGSTPTGEHRGGKFAILLEPVAAGAVGLAAIGGATVCRVNVTDDLHDYATAGNGVSAALVSAVAGPVQILWRQSGTGEGLWAVGRFVGEPDGIVRVTLEQTAGAAGGATDEPTWAYTVTYRGFVVATAASPAVGREVGYFDAATIGTAYLDDSGEWQLLQAFEKPGTVECATDEGE